jgi:transcriptional regulator with XRE-family HTH domain
MNQLGKQILQIRKNKGISQEELAEISKINLRTLQRIEKGETSPHGDTLKRISEALNVPLQDLVSYGYTEDYGYIKILHLSALIFIIIPVGNILLPLVLWLLRKDHVKDLTYFAKKLINFQITWSLVAYFPHLIFFLGVKANLELKFLENLNFDVSTLLYLDYIIWFPLNVIYIVIAAILIKNDKKNYYPVAIRFIK